MKQECVLVTPFVFVMICLFNVHCELLYQCNFDIATPSDNCFTTSILILDGVLSFINDQPPTIPASDVTSSLKPTSNGEVCKLPYQVGTYSWDMYFCYRSHCPTETSTNSTCTSGQYAGVLLSGSTIQSFQLKTESNGINSINEQKLTFYYYISSVGQKSIAVRKQEVDGTNQILDIVTSSPFNGWIERQVTFNAMKRGYKIYFDVQKTSFEFSFIDIALDEISIWGEVELTTEGPITTTTTTSIVIDITTSVPTSVIQTIEMVTSTEESATITIVNTEQVETPTTVVDAETTSYSTSFDIDETTLNIKTSTVSTTTTTTATASAETTKSTTTDERTTTTKDTPPASNKKTLIIILATVIPVVCIALICMIICLKKSSWKKFSTRVSPPSSSNNPNGLSRSTFEHNRVVLS